MATFLHTADLHLGQGGGEALPPKLARVREREIKESLTQIVDLALVRKVDFLLVAGDLFTDQYATPSLLRYVNEQFARFGKKVFLSAGNHDPLFEGSPAKIFPWQQEVFFFPANAWEQVLLPELDLAICGLSWGRERPGEELLMELPPPATGLFNIAVIHGSAGATASLAEDYFPLPTEQLAASGYDYIALGHYHRPSSWQLGKTTFAYPGSPEPLGFGEEGEHGLWFGDTKEAALEFIPLSQRKYQTLSWDCTGMESEGELVAALEKELAGSRQDLVRLNLSGTLPSGFKLDLNSIEDSLCESVFFLELIDNTREKISLSDFPPGSLRQLFSQKLLAELEREEDPRREQLLALALRYGLEALVEGEVELGLRRDEFDY